MQTTCKTCGGELATGIEVDLEMDSQCLKNLVSDTVTLKIEKTRLEEEISKKDQAIRDYLDAARIQASIKEAEHLGRVAAGRNATLEDNPFRPDSDEAASWSYGWVTHTLADSATRTRAVVVWAVGMLGVIAEIARGGADHSEIAEKLEYVVEKISPLLPV